MCTLILYLCCEVHVWMYTLPCHRLTIGLTNFTTKAHLCRATLEAICFQSREVKYRRASRFNKSLEKPPLCYCYLYMNQDSELPLNSVRVDGGMTENELMLQLQADILGIKIGNMNNVMCN